MVKKKSLIEQEFPFEYISTIAEQESWRKEVNRPTSYIHKWWARRLGSVFRALIIGGAETEGTNLYEKFYSGTTYGRLSVFDPFMGSGTTITETIKLGANVVGSDINSIAATIVKTALEKYDRNEVISTYKELESRCSEQIKRFYKTQYDGEEVDVLYYFWVKVIDCDSCGTKFPLYKSTVFSKNAYASKKPQAQSVCPFCGHINQIRYDDKSCICKKCEGSYNPQKGNIRGIEYVCPKCGKHEKIVDYARRTKKIIPERMYAKMVYDADGVKHYADIDEQDITLFKQAQNIVSQYSSYIPTDEIHEGINTNQIINYQYKRWSNMFNARQLLAFGILSEEIKKIPKFELRRLFAVLMSGTLEFNNMFCSFKGEGTGAVRPLFYNHILKNELMPLEANVWGLKASSGSFSTMFETRIIRMLDYKESPFELRIREDGKTEKVPLDHCTIEVTPTDKVEQWDINKPLILCKDSANTELPDECIDLVVTDPPFFDNVNYSELADFFYVWLKKMNVGIGNDKADTTRSAGEVQDNNPKRFSNKLCAVLSETNRLLKKEGLLIFTYHHSKTEGWVSVYNAIRNAGYTISEVIPIKAEMAVSVAIMAAKVPINYDLVFICRKTPEYTQMNLPISTLIEYQNMLKKIKKSNLKFSDGDKAILLYGLALKQLSATGIDRIEASDIEAVINSWKEESDMVIV